ncbi:hypothetical protein BCT61_12620 [Vibrio breoganii]|uniref:hypothetical protein n=1 Tax=Vibrio breoganii TaxID=553239 RepID=UPI000C83FBB6|nr:hypothetical protein [Vibrio breoganii]PMG05201.1 hypothetical protein BCV00_13550 [Vibrio breoganii]PMG89407.1 hypothetical protein BCU81_08535 [Vibrio breoganii]PMM08376.1 hypothetical protein BCT61_12620 [Vibrio breoganii]
MRTHLFALAALTLSSSTFVSALELVDLPNGEGGTVWEVGAIAPDGEYSESTVATISNFSHIVQVHYHMNKMYMIEVGKKPCESSVSDQVDTINGKKVGVKVYSSNDERGKCQWVSVPTSPQAQAYLKNEFLKKNVISWSKYQFTGKGFTKASQSVDAIL